MPGLKQTIFNDHPVTFWSFDHDVQGDDGGVVLDEIDNLNPLTIMGYPNYLLSQQGLNDLELIDQASLRVAKDQQLDGEWREFWLEAPHTNSYYFPELGSFSVEFMYSKKPPSLIRQVGEPGAYADIKSPIIQKGSMLKIYQYEDYNATDYLIADFQGRLLRCYEGDREDGRYPIWNKINHIVFVNECKQVDVNEYQSNISLYVNGIRYGYNSTNYIDEYPNTNVADSWRLCGTGGTNPVTDYQTEELRLDQVAVYDYALTDEQVGNHYRKTTHYDTMIKNDYPNKYWRMDEEENPLDTTMYADVGGSNYNGTYFGNVSNYQTGPEKLIESHGTLFADDANASVTYYNAYGNPYNIININQSYTVEFWFKINDSNRGVFLACIEENYRWDGLIVWANSKDNAHASGNIQVSERYHPDHLINSRDTNPITGERENWNDGRWHHLVVRRNGDYLQLYIDGEKNSEKIIAKVANGDPSQLHIMGMAPGELNINGEMCELAYYNYALQERSIVNRWLYTTRYKLQGYTLLQGNPIQATVRFYEHISGELQGELKSDSLTGEYLYYAPTNRFIDIVSYIPDNKTTRYRIHGPVLPAEYTDSHLN